jgi:hypothetical protein
MIARLIFLKTLSIAIPYKRSFQEEKKGVRLELIVRLFSNTCFVINILNVNALYYIPDILLLS